MRLVSFCRQQALDHEFDEELAAHIELATEEHVRQGMTVSDARRLALIKLGGIEPSKELHRESRGLPWLDGIVQDVRHAVRGLRRSPGFTLTAVATLALGIGVNAMVFTVTNAVLFKGFPRVQSNDRILYMTTSPYCCVSYPDFEDWRASAKSFEGMALVHGVQQTYSDQSGFPETAYTTEVSADTFTVVGQRPLLGRDFAPSDELPGAAPVAILSHGFWERRYGKDPAIVGHGVRINGALTTVIGVMPQGFSFPQNQDLWLPLVPTAEVRTRENHNTWFVFGRMADGVTIETARAEMAAIGKRLESAYPATNKGFPPIVYTFSEFFIGPNATLIYRAMWGAVGFVLLIACANLANLLLARALSGSREISVRIALGAGRWRIIRQLLIESVMLSGLGGLVGWWIAKWGVRLYALAATGAGLSDQINGTWFDHVLDYSLDNRVFAYLVAISIGTGLLFGLAPASRLWNLDVYATLKDGGRGAIGGWRGKRLSALLVISEMALAVVLLVGAGVMIRSFLKIYTADLGFKTEHVVTALFGLPGFRYQGAEAKTSFYDRLKAHLEASPGVESIAITDSLPASGTSRFPLELAGTPPVSGEDGPRRPRVSTLVIGPDYFRTLRAAVLSGRDFSDADGASAPPVAIVNQRFAGRYWPEEEPLGKHLRLFQGTTPGPWLTVVGVVSNIAQNDVLRPDLNALVYLPSRQRSTGGMWVLARTRLPLEGFASTLRREVHAIDPVLPITIGPSSMARQFAERYQYRGVSGAMFLICAAIALMLASVGLYAVIAQSVSRRTQEIGIRTAIGATGRDILKLVLKEGLLQSGIGLLVGLLASLALTPILRSALVQVSPADSMAFVAASVVLLAAAVLGCLIPARRAMLVDPVTALRHD